jgi:hypothetical protein
LFSFFFLSILRNVLDNLHLFLAAFDAVVVRHHETHLPVGLVGFGE